MCLIVMKIFCEYKKKGQNITSYFFLLNFRMKYALDMSFTGFVRFTQHVFAVSIYCRHID